MPIADWLIGNIQRGNGRLRFLAQATWTRDDKTGTRTVPADRTALAKQDRCGPQCAGEHNQTTVEIQLRSANLDSA